jgi:hypothetical protein
VGMGGGERKGDKKERAQRECCSASWSRYPPLFPSLPPSLPPSPPPSRFFSQYYVPDAYKVYEAIKKSVEF